MRRLDQDHHPARDEFARSAPQLVPERRVGRDGRARPVDPTELRARIAEELTRRPEASLRSIAAAVGSSPETVRSVRGKRQAVNRGAVERRPRPSIPRRPWSACSPGTHTPATGSRATGVQHPEGGCEFIAWFDSAAVDPADHWAHVGSVPRSRIYEVADEARRRATFWSHFADSLEGQVRRRA